MRTVSIRGSDRTARPRLTLADIELIKDALDREGLASKDVERLEACCELSAKLERSALALRQEAARG